MFGVKLLLLGGGGKPENCIQEVMKTLLHAKRHDEGGSGSRTGAATVTAIMAKTYRLKCQAPVRRYMNEAENNAH